VLLLIIMNL